MTWRCGGPAAVLASLLFAYSGMALAFSTFYTQTLGTTPRAVVDTDPGFPFTNCIAAEGCFGKAGQVDTPVGGNLPAAFTFTPLRQRNGPGRRQLRASAR